MSRKQGISLIMPVYHDGVREHQMEYLMEAIDSILRARSHPKMPPHELMIVDDGSKDPQTKLYLEQVAHEHDWIKFIPLETNGGPSRARNVAIKHSSYDHIAGIDCDDIIKQNYAEFLSKAIASLSTDPNLTAAISGIETLEKYPRRINKVGNVKLADAILYFSIVTTATATLYRYIDLERAGFYREDSIRNEDVKLGVDVLASRNRIGLNNKLTIAPRNYYSYRVHSDGRNVNARKILLEELVKFLVSGAEDYYQKLHGTSDIAELSDKVLQFERKQRSIHVWFGNAAKNFMSDPVGTMQNSSKLKSLFNVLGINRPDSKHSQAPSTDPQPN